MNIVDIGMKLPKTETKETSPLSWQHSNKQGRIDTLIEMESKPKKPYRYEDTVEYALELFWQNVN